MRQNQLAESKSGLPGGRRHGPFAQKWPQKICRGRGNFGAVRGREGAAKVPKRLKRGRGKFWTGNTVYLIPNLTAMLLRCCMRINVFLSLKGINSS
jgi:hypothetical protein